MWYVDDEQNKHEYKEEEAENNENNENVNEADSEDDNEENGNDNEETEQDNGSSQRNNNGRKKDRDSGKNKEGDENSSQPQNSQEGQSATKPEGKNGGNSDGSLDPDKVKNDMNELGNKPSEGGTPGSQSPTGATSGANPSAGATGTETAGTSGTAAGTGAASGTGATTTGAAGATGTGVAATGTGAAAATGTGAAAAGTGAAAGTAGTAAAAAGTAATPVGWVLLIIAAIIFAIILIVGIVCFFIYMPGQVTGKLKDFAAKLLDKVQAMVEGEENVVHGEEVADVANYLEKMGYDLKGEGFVTDDITNYTVETENGTMQVVPQPKNSKLDHGLYRDNDTDEVLAIYSNPIKTYLVSDKLCYIVKNANQNLMSAWGNHPVQTILAGIAVVAAFIVSPVAGLAVLFTFVAVNGGNPSWGSGLISIYHEGGRLGERGDFYRDIETGYIELLPETKQLKVKRGWTNNAYSFDVDGWSGRYGMPLEFLLSVHIATQMPDLAMDIATSFDTDVEVLLHKVDNGTVTAGFQMPSGEKISYQDIMDILATDDSWGADAWNSIVDWFGSHTSFIDSDEWETHSCTDRNYYTLFAKGMPHSTSCSCCSHIPGAAGSEEEDCDGTGTLEASSSFAIGDHTICKDCKKYINRIISALREVQDNNWNAYTPYVARVTDHWFRDVYYVIDDINNTGVVVNDEQYFYETGERWSIYETYKSGDKIPDGFSVGDYKLYEYSYDESTKKETYTLSTKTKAEVEEINKKIADGDTSVSRLVKKPVTQKLTDIKDAEGNALIQGIDGNRWVAYTTETNEDSDWIELSMDVEGDNIPAVLEGFEHQIFYKETRPDDIKQIEDGQRLATNPKIKKMFVENKYYQYDGTEKKADAIAEDRRKNNNTSSDVSKNNTSEDKRDEKLLGKVSISKDSLTAFSMLENTHTLDADYVYRDFKELVVELNYFDKEDLSDKIEEVMTWIIPDCGSAGWPIRKYEKGETFYGTLINSKVDLDFMKGKDIERAEQELENTEEEVPTTNKTPATAGKAASGSMANFIEKAYEVHKAMEGNDWHYCILSNISSNGPHMKKSCGNDNCNLQHCDTLKAGASHTCGLNSTIQEAIAGHHNTCCATYVSWALKEAGFDLSGHPNMHGAKATYDWAEASGFTPITDYADMEAGDLLFNKYNYDGNDVNMIGHVQILGNDGEWLNAGSVEAINDPPKAYEAKFIIGMRPPLSGAAKPFEGYEPDQAVVAPITGKVIDYGEVTRKNIETDEDETVEYIKIEAIDKYVFDKQGKGYTACKAADENNTFEKKASEDAKKLEGYDYFYDEYSGVVEGYILYIEGFDLTLFDSDGSKALVDSGDIDSAEVTRYTENLVLNMVDDLEEARAWWKEDAKAQALPLVEINGELYIKEGTVIGKTYEDSKLTDEQKEKQKGNGNYIRLILRNLDDTIVEDVETYFNIDNAVKNKCDFEQFAYYLGCLLESFKKDDDLGDSYGFEVLEDDAGNTTAFGLTSAVAETVQSTYPNFAAHLAAGRVPKDEAQDVFILVLEAAKESIQKQLNTPLDDDDSSLFALMDLHHASPTECEEVIKIYNSKNNNLSKEEMIAVFTEHWGTNMNYEVQLKSRGVNRGLLASEGRFLLYQEGSQGDEVIFDSETPWSEFCDAGGTYEMTLESSGLYHVEKGVYKNYPVSY